VRYLVLTLLILASNAYARDTYTVYGPGNDSCGKWLDARAKEPNYSAFVQVYSAWVLGYVTAYGNYGPDLKRTDASAIDAWVDNYCRQNPLDNLNTAAKNLVEALKTK